MARSAAALAVAMVVLVAMAAMVPSASAAPCAAIQTLLPCLSAAKTGAQPPQACCDAIGTFAQGGTVEGEKCLCDAVNTQTAKTAGMQLQYAVLMPQKCNLPYKAGYNCNGMIIPGGHA